MTLDRYDGRYNGYFDEEETTCVDDLYEDMPRRTKIKRPIKFHEPGKGKKKQKYDKKGNKRRMKVKF